MSVPRSHIAVGMTLIVAVLLGTLIDQNLAWAAEKKNIKIGLGVPTTSHLTLYLAQQKGFFKQEGLDTELVVFQSGPEALSIYMSGTIDVALLGITEVFTAQEAGKDIKIFWQISDAMPYELWANPKFPTLKDSKGARFGISKYGAFSDFITRWTLRQAGLDPDKDVKMLQLGGPGARMAAISKGVVDVTILDPPEGLQAKKAGMILQTKIYDYLPRFPVQQIILDPRWVDQNPETTRAVIRAVRKATLYAKANKAECLALFRDQFRYSDEVAELAYNFYLPSFPYDGSVWEKGLQVAIEDAVTSKRITRSYRYDDLVDTRYVKEFAGKP